MKSSSILIIIIIITMLSGCDEHDLKRDFHISHVAVWPYEIKGLRNRIIFCQTCLKNQKCNSYEENQCRTVTLPDRVEALNLAIIKPNSEAVYLLVDVAKTDVNAPFGEYDETPLMVAAYYGTKQHEEIAKFLISRGADVNAMGESTTNTALLTAIWKNHIDFAKLLLNNGANPSLTSTGEQVGYACKYAVNRKKFDFIAIIPNCCSLIKKDPNSTTEIKSHC